MFEKISIPAEQGARQEPIKNLTLDEIRRLRVELQGKKDRLAQERSELESIP